MAADGGSTSPLALLFFVPVVFAALSYPLASVIAISALDYIAYVAVGVAGARPDQQYVGFFAFSLACVAVLCGWHARNQDRRRAALSRVSRADPLTGCLNRRGFEERFDAELSRASRTGRPLGLVMLDLDHFKEINDTRGHAAGDDVLRWAVDVMNEVVRPMDVVGRIGGDEFAIVVPGAGPDDSAAIAGRVQKALADRAPSSVGVACFPTDGADREELQRRCRRRSLRGQARTGPTGGIKLTAKELSWATALARAVDERMAVQHEHSWKVARALCRDRVAAGLVGAQTSSCCRWPRSSTTSGRSRSPTTSCASATRSPTRSGRRSSRTPCGARRWSRASRASRRSSRGSATRTSASTGAATPTASAATRSRRPAGSCTWPTPTTR